MVLLQSERKNLQPGDHAPGFNLKNIDDKMVSLSEFQGKAVAIIFMCNHCPYVIPKMDEIASLERDFKDVVLICINSNDTVKYPEDDFEHMKEIAQEKGYALYLLDETQEVAKAYGAVCTPDPYVFDKEHKLVYHGRINNAMNPDDTPTKHDLREVLEAVTAGKPVEKWFVPSQGCSIKWK